eukprot:TRINITY_DN12775_c0_g1_i1.p1 TRINITY_DN12775_c0_g1~~TRINITY_DN12775_c0_g1_i1.p1  ORF type:complete len:199 (-),score=47.02 TRINITY_DN12775_c0_g1_i1:46-642(-)
MGALERILQIARLLASMLVLVAAFWQFFVPGGMYTIWIVSAVILFLTIVIIITDIPKLGDSQRIKTNFGFLTNMLLKGFYMILIGLLLAREPNYVQAQLALAGGVIMASLGLLHIFVWFVVYIRNRRRAKQEGAGAGTLDADGTMPPAGSLNADGPNDNPFMSQTSAGAQLSGSVFGSQGYAPPPTTTTGTGELVTTV